MERRVFPACHVICLKPVNFQSHELTLVLAASFVREKTHERPFISIILCVKRVETDRFVVTVWVIISTVNQTPDDGLNFSRTCYGYLHGISQKSLPKKPSNKF